MPLLISEMLKWENMYLKMNEIKYFGNYELGEFEVNLIFFSDFVVC